MTTELARRGFLRGMACGVGALAVPRWLTAAGAVPGGRRPNIVYILADDLGWHDLHGYGCEAVKTPNLDRLAAEGMRFSQAYAACSVCSPTRASIMTGQYPARLHLTDFIPGRGQDNTPLLLPEWTQALSADQVTLAEALKKAGYATALVAKWHLGGKPTEHGFDEELVGNHSPQADDPLLTERQSDAAIAFIERNKARPFFCYLAYNAVHAPIVARPELEAAYAGPTADKVKPGAKYFALLEEMDRGVGRVLARVEELGLSSNTIVVFVSDNGGFLGSTVNTPLRLGKGWLYEGGVRVPMIVRWPGVVKPGSESDAPVCSVDHFATLAEAVGIEAPTALDGVSLVPLMKGGDAPTREALYWHYPHYHQGPPSGAVRAGDWKLIEFFEDMRVELYNLKDDPGEAKDLAKARQDKAGELREKLHRWRESVGAQMMAPNPNYDRAAGKRAAPKARRKPQGGAE